MVFIVTQPSRPFLQPPSTPSAGASGYKDYNYWAGEMELQPLFLTIARAGM